MSSTIDGIETRAQRGFAETVRRLAREVDSVLANPGAATGFGHGVYELSGGAVLALPRRSGDSRHPYGRNGFNFWAYASGYMHANDGLFSVFPKRCEGQEPCIAFFMGTREGDGWSPIPLLGVPALVEADRQELGRFTIFDRSAVYYFTRSFPFLTCVRVVAEQIGSLSFSVLISNEGEDAVEVLLSAFFNPMLRHQIYESDEDRWFREFRTLRNPQTGALRFLLKINEDRDRQTSITRYFAIDRTVLPMGEVHINRDQATPSRFSYMGELSRNLGTALPLRKGTFASNVDVCCFTEPAICGDLLTARIGATADLILHYHFTNDVDPRSGMDPASRPASSWSKLDHQIEELNHRKAKEAGALRLTVRGTRDPRIPAETFNAFFEHLKTQVEFCALIKGHVQLSENSLIGIRDVFQALEALLYWRPEVAKEKIMEALSYTLTNGRCLRQYALPQSAGTPPRMDTRLFVDQGNWVISTMSTYLRLTGDRDFLRVICPYHELINEGGERIQKSLEEGTVLDHLCRIMDFLLAQRAPDTGAIRALYGDWNDALDGLGTLPGNPHGYGNGVSVMASLHVYQNLGEMVAILTLAGDAEHGECINTYLRSQADLSEALLEHAIVHGSPDERRIVHGWGHNRAYYVGSFKDVDGHGRDSVTANAFWVLSDMLAREPSLEKDILHAFQRLDSPYGLKTFHPPFDEEVKGVGRIGKLPKGTAENGATYVHATLFGISALFEMGRSSLAWDQIRRILPFTPDRENYSHSPFVLPNSYGYNPDLNIDGQNMNDWQTGSSNVLLKALIRYMVGFQIRNHTLLLVPASHCPFEEWACTLSARGIAFDIHYQRIAKPKRRFLLNGEPFPAIQDPKSGLPALRMELDELPPRSHVTIHVLEPEG